MKVSKDEALDLIAQKMRQFERIMGRATYDNRYDEEYNVAYYGTEALLTELFSADEARKFINNVKRPPVVLSGGIIAQKLNQAEEVDNYKKHLQSCILQLKVYRERIFNFWADDEPEQIRKASIIPFVSISFDEKDKEINGYVTSILKALRVDFETGERYSKDSIPEKVKNRIANSGLFIVIFVKRDKIENASYSTSPWLIKELGIAQGCKKEIIAWVEKGISDKGIANLNWEKEIIYFERTDTEEMKKATIKFLEALKEHKLI